MKLRSTITLAITIGALATAPAASAHVTFSTNNTAAGGFATGYIQLSHGCEGNATTSLELQVPEGVNSFKVSRHPFWDGTVTMRTLDEPIEGSHGEKITEVPDVATFTSKQPLADGVLDIIPVSLQLPDEEGQLDFPIVQKCEKGTETSWTQIAKEGEDEPESPAPSITVTAAGEGHDGASDTHAEEDDAADDAKDAGHDGMDEVEDDVDTARTLGIAGIVIGALGLLFGLVALRRRK